MISEDLNDEKGGFAATKADGKKLAAALNKDKYQTALDLHRSTGLSMDVVDDWLETARLNRVIGEQAIGARTAYFLLKNAPEGKLYFGGADGRTICLREEPPRGNTGTQRAGETIVQNLRIAPQKSKIEPPKFTQRSHRNIDEDEIERMAAVNPDKDIIADYLNINRARFRYDLIHAVSLGRAYEKGKTIYMENTKVEDKVENDTEEQPDQTAGEAANGTSTEAFLKSRLTAAVMEKAAAGGVSTAKLAKQLGCDAKLGGKIVDKILYNKKNLPLRQAWDRGRASRNSLPTGGKIEDFDTDVIEGYKKTEEKTAIQLPGKLPNAAFTPIEKSDANFTELPDVEVDSRFSHTLDHIAENGHSREKLEEVKNKLIGVNRPIFNDVEFIGRISSRRAPGLQIGFEGDFFLLSEKQRMLLCEMANLHDEFHKES